MGRDILLVNEEPTSAIDGGSGLLKKSRRIPCRVLSYTKNSEELRSSNRNMSDDGALATYRFRCGSLICDASSVSELEDCDIVVIMSF